MTITFRIYSAELALIGITVEQCGAYRDRLHEAIVARYPAADIAVDVIANTSGHGSGVRVVSDPDDDCDEHATEADVREISDRVLDGIVNA